MSDTTIPKMISEITQGTKFRCDDSNKIYMRLPEFVMFQDQPCNAIDIRSGTLICFRYDKKVNVLV